MTRLKAISITLLFMVGCVLSVPIPDGSEDYSRVLYDRNGELLTARIASDEQWRFPIDGELPEELTSCILHFEDEYFYFHPGINPVSILKAVWSNYRAGKIVRGGSTISMQVMRMSRGNRSRNLWQKGIECLGAIKLELFHGKEEILKMWASMAPMGGNTVGASTGAWRYFRRDLSNLSLAEYATLAVLPNSPSSVHFQKRTDILKSRRDFLLTKLYQNQIIDSINWALSLDEPVPEVQFEIPFIAHHFFDFCRLKHPDETIFESTIDQNIQHLTQTQINEASLVYQQDGINHASAVVIDNKTGQLLAYVGNSTDGSQKVRFVDCVQAPRSYGSLLKPFLYAYALDEGFFLPHENVKDIPTFLNGFSPRNYDLAYRGEVPFEQMVSLSLNVPAVRTLNYVGLHSFHHVLKNKLEMEYVNSNADHHGLSLILGGAEGTLWEMARLYKGLCWNHGSRSNPYSDLLYLKNQTIEPSKFQFDPVSVSHTLDAMASVERPPEEQNFVKYGGAEIAWKTGTSYGHRDAWAVGTTPEYTVAVWVGNETGEGVYDLVGAKKAAPILFRIFGTLSGTSSFKEVSTSQRLSYCLESGKLASQKCPRVGSIPFSGPVHRLRQCHSHHILTGDTVYTQNATVRYYYDRYRGRTNRTSSMEPRSSGDDVAIVYPENGSIIFLPKKINQDVSQLECIAQTGQEDQTLFWYVNGEYIRKTHGDHSLHLTLPTGMHKVYVVDEKGKEDSIEFEISKRSDP